MSDSSEATLTDQQIADYNKDGFLIIRDVLSSSDAEDLRKLTRSELDRLSFPPKLKYPAPGKYTISGNSLAEPGFGPIAEHPTIVSAVETLLGEPAHLTAYVAYLRSPGDKGSGAHCDYKRWRPVGSSMNWMFAIVPLTDFSPEYGPLLVSPGSHRLLDVIDKEARIWDVSRPNAKLLSDFIDPELKAGDLLLMHGGTWHKAPAGTTSQDRAGIFNKYCGVSAPPAAGYYPYSHASYEALSDRGRRLIPDHYDEPLSSTRLLIEDSLDGDSRYLIVGDDQSDWSLPGGSGWEEEKVGWDVGARIGACQSHVKDQLGHDIPWMSYIQDAPEGSGLCRFYGYTGSDTVDLASSPNCRWSTQRELVDRLGESDPICHAINNWKRTDVIRGKGKAIGQSKTQYE